jgi:hypothetical protein
MLRWTLPLLALVGCYEDGTRELGEACYESVDCVEGLLCDNIVEVCYDPKAGKPLGGGGGGGGGGAGGGDDDTCWECITCNDGTRSPTCTECSSGCCSGHGGCS